jgi:MATE family multidrug resistance protein
MIILLEKPLIWLGQDAQIATLTVHFLQIVAPGLLPCLWFQTLRHFTVGLKYPGPLLLITIISIALTIVFNYVLVFGKFGFSAMGLSGIALSTAIIFLLSFLMFLVVVLRHPKLAGYFNFSKFKFDRSTLKTVWKLGLPIAATYASEAGFFTILTLLIGTLGVNALAAQTVINQIIYIVFMISAGISHAASILISESYSVQNYAHVRRLGHIAVIISSACMAVIAIIYLLFPKQIIALFISGQYALQPVMMSLMITGLAIAALLQFFDAVQNIGNGILRGIGDTVTPFKLSIVGYWLIGLPAAYLLSKVFYFGVYGVWFGLTIGLTVTALLLLYFFYKRLNTLQHITSVDVTTVNKTNF